MNLLPQPKMFKFDIGFLDLNKINCLDLTINYALKNQEYIIEINSKSIKIQYSCEQSLFYARKTLAQIIKQQKTKIRCCFIHDYPDFEYRGVMIDVGRYKIPSMETLFRVVDILSSVKVNQLQLYFEGFSFAYNSHPQVWKNKDVLTPDNIRKLDQYCKERFIDLVPCQNAFGHMKHWLVRDEYHQLGESPDGFIFPWGYEPDCSTLDPLNPESFELTKSLYDDVIPCFQSNLVNLNFDETFELGNGKNKGKDKGKLYFDYLIKTYNYLKEKYPQKQFMFWADIMEQYPEYIEKLPKDLILLAWKYGKTHPTKEELSLYKHANNQFYICPTTYCHITICGKTDYMMQNISHSAINGKAAGAMGFLNTHWGDCGNWDSTSFSFAPYIYGAAKSWNVDHEPNLEEYLNSEVFQDESGIIGKIVLELGDFHRYDSDQSEYLGNGLFRNLYYYQLDEQDKDLDFLNFPSFPETYFQNAIDHINQYNKLLDNVQLRCTDAKIVKKEINLTIRMLLHSAALGLYKQKPKNRSDLWLLYDDLITIIADFRECWFLRNRNVGIEDSLYKLKLLMQQYQKALNIHHIKV